MKGSCEVQYTEEVKEEKKAIVVFSGHVARSLLKKGYTIIDIKPDKRNPLKSVFVFKNEGNFSKDLSELIKK